MILKEKILFSEDECKSIISLKNTNVTNWKMKDRKYDSQTINHSNENMWLFDKLKLFFENETNIQIQTIKNQLHFHKFIKGDWFGKHNDIRENRLYAVGVLLNDNFEGGDFLFYNPTEQRLDKTIGNTYIFDVRIEHEITPILEGERYSLLWFLQGNHIKPQINKIL
jgi:murein L,D-transpeptidase YafK